VAQRLFGIGEAANNELLGFRAPPIRGFPPPIRPNLQEMALQAEAAG